MKRCIMSGWYYGGVGVSALFLNSFHVKENLDLNSEHLYVPSFIINYYNALLVRAILIKKEVKINETVEPKNKQYTKTKMPA